MLLPFSPMTVAQLLGAGMGNALAPLMLAGCLVAGLVARNGLVLIGLLIVAYVLHRAVFVTPMEPRPLGLDALIGAGSLMVAAVLGSLVSGIVAAVRAVPSASGGSDRG